MKLPPKAKSLTGGQEAVWDFAEDLARSLDDDVADEGFFYTDTPSEASVAKPAQPLENDNAKQN